MDFAWTSEQRAAYDEVRASVAETFAPTADAGRLHDRDAWRRLGQLGLLGLCIPAEYGGGGLGALDTALRVEAFGRGCADTGLVFASGAHLFACAMPVAGFGTPELKKDLLPRICSGEVVAGNAMTEAGAGSDVSRLAVTATATPDGYLLNGEKTFVTNGPVADVLVTYATTDPAAGHLGVTAFVLDCDTPGLTVSAPLDKMGLVSAPAGRVSFEDCPVPAHRVLGEPGQGAAIFQHSMRWERACLFAGYVGLLDRLVERCVQHATSRRQFGRRISDFQAVANRIVEMKLRTESARLLLYRCCWEMDNDAGSELNVALSKLAVSEAAVASALDAVRLFGGLGYLREAGIETVLRDAVPSTIFSGTSDVQRLLIAHELGL
ncbi:acyl-CoA dehydrogenase family protein [Micromonospora sp. NPDC005413]|uniref:acyl-CoA dehydrogenase family protein n=1 Tax=Micromonospora sp. NPDC005413 TaxID=3154563 RepID=UPI0033B51201